MALAHADENVSRVPHLSPLPAPGSADDPRGGRAEHLPAPAARGPAVIVVYVLAGIFATFLIVAGATIVIGVIEDWDD